MTQKTIGRPLKQPPEKAEEVIRELSATGHAIIGIAHQLGTSVDTFKRWLDEDVELKAAFDQGREKERHTLHNVLYTAATVDKNTTAAMFLLKARHGYREGDQGESNNRVSINFTLPGAMTMKDFKVIEDVKPNN
ncbi:hypothetical protein [Candidatus Nitrotoga arctica]|uniref:Uncharacterized protein n=1 Tax=Candidatus Nitrotoga arctica TaxID=453162 RepID=A0ABM8YXF6_9PROT|nr:hypothetical protein [Candidatus Nitrotoga arctica]CAG9932210.1 conserved protein of unknown function [Candidatus Nitrotoga arctica]